MTESSANAKSVYEDISQVLSEPQQEPTRANRKGKWERDGTHDATEPRSPQVPQGVPVPRSGTGPPESLSWILSCVSRALRGQIPSIEYFPNTQHLEGPVTKDLCAAGKWAVNKNNTKVPGELGMKGARGGRGSQREAGVRPGQAGGVRWRGEDH